VRPLGFVEISYIYETQNFVFMSTKAHLLFLFEPDDSNSNPHTRSLLDPF